MIYPESLAELIAELKKMPTIGPKSAERLAFYILGLSFEESKLLANSILKANKNIKKCSQCFNLTDQDPCLICQDARRDKDIICVTATAKEVIALEKTGEYLGLYHVLGGVISPLDNISPNKLTIKELLQRIKNNQIKELIMLLNPTIEGEATILYLVRLLKPLGIKITKIAYGLPVGSEIDYADEITLSRAMSGRQEI